MLTADFWLALLFALQTNETRRSSIVSNIQPFLKKKYQLGFLKKNFSLTQPNLTSNLENFEQLKN